MKFLEPLNRLNAYEYLKVNKPNEFEEIVDVIAHIDASSMLKRSKAKAKKYGILYSQIILNKVFRQELCKRGWNPMDVKFNSTTDMTVEQEIAMLKDAEEQERIIEKSGNLLLRRRNQIDFVKNRVALEVQFGKAPYVTYDMIQKFKKCYENKLIDVGIEIVPTLAMSKKMDSGVPAFEIEASNILSHGRSYPEVPLLLLGIEPEIFTI